MREWFRKWRPEMPIVLQIANKAHWKDARTWLYYTLFGGLLPFWGTGLILYFINRSQPLAAYLSNGELAVFCAGLLTSALPTMRRRIKDASIDHPEWLHLTSLVGIAIVLVLFASVTIARQVSAGNVTPRAIELDNHAILVTSLGVFVVSVAVCFMVEVIHNVRLSPADVKAIAERREDELTLNFHRMRETTNG